MASTLQTCHKKPAPALLLVIKDHRFEPTELKVPSGQRVRLIVPNQHATPEKFEPQPRPREADPCGRQGDSLHRAAQAGQLQLRGRIQRSHGQGRRDGRIGAGQPLMFTTALIVFRETLEAALFIGIVTAATRELAGRSRWLTAGVAAGHHRRRRARPARPAPQRLAPWAQDVVNIGILTLALAMLLWHCVWVSAHTREMVSQARQLGHAVQQGNKAPLAVWKRHTVSAWHMACHAQIKPGKKNGKTASGDRCGVEAALS